MNKVKECSLCSPSLKPIIFESQFWKLVLNINQNFLGKCFLVLKRHNEDVNGLSIEEWNDLQKCIRQVTKGLKETFTPDHFNYAFLQNQDRHVHLHIIPRYASERECFGITFSDPDYPAHYSVPSPSHRISDENMTHLAEMIKLKL